MTVLILSLYLVVLGKLCLILRVTRICMKGYIQKVREANYRTYSLTKGGQDYTQPTN